MKKKDKTIKKPVYSPPDVESEEIFERRALACGKCRTGAHKQHACFRLPSTSWLFQGEIPEYNPFYLKSNEWNIIHEYRLFIP